MRTWRRRKPSPSWKIPEFLTEECPKGARAFELESDRYGGHEFQLTTANPDFGLLEFVQQKRLIHGFFVNWFPEPTKVDEKDARLVIRVK